MCRPKSCVNLCRRSSRSVSTTNRQRCCIRSPFNVDEAVRDTVESFAELAQAKDCSLDISSLPELIFCGDEAAVRQLGSILLDNAVKYAVPDTVIHVSLEPLRRGVQLAVENDYVQPIDVPLDRLFDRFYRPDASRTAATGELESDSPSPRALPRRITELSVPARRRIGLRLQQN